MAGPRGIELIRQQLNRLAERRISVYWAAGTVDRAGRWPAGVSLPACVHRFEQPQVKAIAHRRGDQAIATILGRGRDRNGQVSSADFRRDAAGGYSIAVCHAAAKPEDLRGGQVDYWALGGKHSACKVSTGRRLAQYCGSPQGRCETEEGPHGCVLVEVDEQHHAQRAGADGRGPLAHAAGGVGGRDDAGRVGAVAARAGAAVKRDSRRASAAGDLVHRGRGTANRFVPRFAGGQTASGRPGRRVSGRAASRVWHGNAGYLDRGVRDRSSTCAAQCVV